MKSASCSHIAGPSQAEAVARLQDVLEAKERKKLLGTTGATENPYEAAPDGGSPGGDQTGAKADQKNSGKNEG